MSPVAARRVQAGAVASALYHGDSMKDRQRDIEARLIPAPPVVAVGGVVYRLAGDGQVELLLLKKQGGFWTLPKGHVEAGESHSHAAQREIHEETGLSAEVGERICAVSYVILKQGIPRTKIVTYYVMRANPGRLRPSKQEKIVRLKWFPSDQALRRIKRARVRDIAEQALILIARLDHP